MASAPGLTVDDGLPGGLSAILAADDSTPVVFIRREASDFVEVFAGPVSRAEKLSDIRLDGRDVVTAVPFRQIRERGFDAIEDDSELLYLSADQKWSVPVDVLVGALPQHTPQIEDLGFDITDQAYAQKVRGVIETEIGSGEGANFVIRRDYRAHTDTNPREASLAWLRRLLVGERGAYWTFAFITDQVCLVGASPERHVSAKDGKVLMNPISGTFRHGGQKASVDDLLAFLADRKESEELVMVVDEELKMMSAVCPGGGVMRGPFLKPMSRVTHTEYLLEGESDLDVREILRLTMFAPTVTGSPMGNACTVIARHEQTGRGYYSGVLAHFEPTEDGYQLDAPILIRTAVLTPDGNISVSAGATLVRHSDPLGEALETRVKASGALTALGLLDSEEDVPLDHHSRITESRRVQAALEDRNRDLAPFWRDVQVDNRGDIHGSVLVVDCDDDFTTMIAHQLSHLGMDAQIVRWDEVPDVQAQDLVVFGPGPGDPNDGEDPRVIRLRKLIGDRIERGEPTVTVCYSHQVLATLAGLPVVALSKPRQGQPLYIDLFGQKSLIGFYNTFAARGRDGRKTPQLDLTIHAESQTDVVHSFSGPGLASVQGHLESVLSFDGFRALRRVVKHALNTAPAVIASAIEDPEVKLP